ncbi:AtpZ/AtpI family protein [Alteromonas sp. A081]|uniref:AtpZ/AtpI family protein n=1 Tax=Alteromonas sp. A081 TaxID=3410269 RepID=UPI003B97EE3F
MQFKLKKKIEPQSDLKNIISIKVRRKVQAREGKALGVWFGFGMMGLIGWSVAIPTLLGASLGVYLDTHYPINLSWTLALLSAGLVLGCFNAWHWLWTEESAIHEKSRVHQKKDQKSHE